MSDEAENANSPAELPDEILVLQCRLGDAASLDLLLQRWQERWWRRAWQITRDEHAAWDILQETCLAIASDIGRVREPTAFPSWSFQIVANKAGDWIRQHTRRRRREAVFAEGQEIEAAPAETPGDPDFADHTHGLSDEDRSLLSLRYESGLGLAEIARAIGIPVGTVKSRLHHAKQRLRILLEETS